MKTAKSWSLTAAAALLLGAAPVQSSANEQPVPAVGVSGPLGLEDVMMAPVASVEPASAALRQVMTVVEDPAEMAPGAFAWRPDLALGGPIEMVVSIPQQRAYVFRAGTLIGVTTVSTGRQGHATPTGRFPILEKRREHHSNLYNNAPMPFMQRLTWDGIALHAGTIPGRPASHGCVRLPLEFARLLFAETRVGGVVHIIDGSPQAHLALAMARGNRFAANEANFDSPVRGTR